MHSPLVIASAAKQSRLSPRKDSGLLRCARNDDVEATSRYTPLCPGRSAALLQRCAAEPGPMSPRCAVLLFGSRLRAAALQRVRETRGALGITAPPAPTSRRWRNATSRARVAARATWPHWSRAPTG